MMVSVLSYCNNENELYLIEESIKYLAARLTDEKWDIFSIISKEELYSILKKMPVLDMACFDVCTDDGIYDLIEVRKKYAEMMLMIIADETISPMEYIKPSINPLSLLIRPYDEDDIREKLRELIIHFLTSNNNDEYLIVERKDGKQRIPYSQILYFEARNKKIYARLLNKEVSFYGVLDSIEKELPKSFMRCHRSFIVNKYYIDRVMISKNIIELTKNVVIPLSRSYKMDFK